MSKKIRENIAAQCPFWKGVDNRSHKIICEGVMDNSSIHLVFAGYNNMRQYCKKYCENLEGFKNCIIYDTLDYHKYYEADENATTKD